MTEHDDKLDPVGYASLAEDDPERAEIYQRAEGDEALRKELADGEKLMALLDYGAPMPPSDAALARVAAALQAEMSEMPSPKRQPLWANLAIGGGALLTWILLLSVTGRWAALREPAGLWSLAFAAGATLLAAVASRRQVFGILGIGVLSLGLAALSQQAGSAGSLGVGIKCAMLSLGGAIAPLLIAGVLSARRLHHLGSLGFAAISASGALAALAVLHVACPNHQLGHLMIFHVGSVVVAGMLGAGIGRIPGLARAA